MRPALTALLAIVAIAACNKDREEPEAPAPATYTVRGKVIELPAAPGEEGPATIAIHHEAIPNFVGASGKQQPMMAMEMPFGLADGLDLAAIEPGDVVEFRFEVDFAKQPPTRIVELRELPAGTELAL